MNVGQRTRQTHIGYVTIQNTRATVIITTLTQMYNRGLYLSLFVCSFASQDIPTGIPTGVPFVGGRTVPSNSCGEGCRPGGLLRPVECVVMVPAGFCFCASPYEWFAALVQAPTPPPEPAPALAPAPPSCADQESSNPLALSDGKDCASPCTAPAPPPPPLCSVGSISASRIPSISPCSP